MAPVHRPRHADAKSDARRALERDRRSDGASPRRERGLDLEADGRLGDQRDADPIVLVVDGELALKRDRVGGVIGVVADPTRTRGSGATSAREGSVGVRDCAGHVLRHPGPELPPHLLDGPPRVLLRSFENRVHDAAQAADVAIHSSRREDGQAPRLSRLALRPRPHARTERESAPARGLVDARDGRESPVNRERDAHALSPDDAQHRAHVLRRLVRGGCRR